MMNKVTMTPHRHHKIEIQNLLEAINLGRSILSVPVVSAETTQQIH